MNKNLEIIFLVLIHSLYVKSEVRDLYQLNLKHQQVVDQLLYKQGKIPNLKNKFEFKNLEAENAKILDIVLLIQEGNIPANVRVLNTTYSTQEINGRILTLYDTTYEHGNEKEGSKNQVRIILDPFAEEYRTMTDWWIDSSNWKDAREEGLFRRSGRQNLRKRILLALKKGEKTHFDNDTDTVLESAAALRLYLTYLKKPVIPLRVQELILADNPGVEAQEVARDALGLIRQDISGRHGELLADILGLLRHLTLSAPPSECSELHGSPLPIALLPVFFNLTPADLMKWKQVAARFNELINEAPEQLRLDSRSEASNVQNNHLPNPEETDQWRRMQNISFLYPVFTLVNARNAYPVAENAPVFLAPLHRPPPGRLHLAISNLTS